MSKKIKLNHKIKPRILSSVLTSILLPMVVCLAIPFEIYSNNVDEFIFSALDFLPLSLLIGFVFALICFTILILIPEKAYKIVKAILLSLALLFFVQGTYLNKDFNSLNGDNLGTSNNSQVLIYLNLLLWIAVITVAIIFSIRKDSKGIFSTICMVLTAIILVTQIINPLSVVISNDKIFLSWSEKVGMEEGGKQHQILSNKNLDTISTSNNIFYFCIDRFDEDYAEEAYEYNPQIFDDLDGFTWFQDNISLYGHTYPAVTNLLTRKEHNIEVDRKKYLKTVYEENDTLSILAENGYDINLFTQQYYAVYDASYLPDYVSNVSKNVNAKVSNKYLISANMINMAIYRCLPSFVKNFIFDVDSTIGEKGIEELDENGNLKYSLDMKDVFDFVNNKNFNSTSNKTFSFVHLEGCHSVAYDTDWNKASISEKFDTKNSVINSFAIIKQYIRALKQANMYDSATIIITGDHANPGNDLAPLKCSKITALFVKPSNSSGTNLVKSSAQVCHDNIWPTIMKSENITVNGNYGKSVFDINENETQTRKYIWQTYESNKLTIYTYSIKGLAKNFDNYKLVDSKSYNHGLMY